jgi:hypothetical protein
MEPSPQEMTMPERFTLTPTQLNALRALNECVVESSPIEVAVSGLMLPGEARSALARLEQLGLASSWMPITGRTGQHLYVSTDEGTNVYRALGKLKSTPPVGSVFRVLPANAIRMPSSIPPVFVEIAPEVQDVTEE